MVATTLMTTRDRNDLMSESSRLEGLFEAHRTRLYRLACRLSRSPEEAHDLVQETFLRAARRIGTVPRVASREEAWLVRALVNLCRDGWRRQKVRGQQEPVSEVHAAQARGTEEAIVARATVESALARLSPRPRAVIVLHELEERPVKEVARLLGVAQVTVRWHLHTARKRLVELLLPEEGGRSGGRKK